MVTALKSKNNNQEYLQIKFYLYVFNILPNTSLIPQDLTSNLKRKI